MNDDFKVCATEDDLFKSIDIKVEGRYMANVWVVKPNPACGRVGKVTIHASTTGKRSIEILKKYIAAVQYAIKLAEIEDSRLRGSEAESGSLHDPL